MNRIMIQTPDPIVEKLLSLFVLQLSESVGNVVLLDAAWLDRIGLFSGSRIIAFTASADPSYLTAAQEVGADGFWYLRPSEIELGLVLAGEPAFPEQPPTVQMGNAVSSDLTRRELEVLREIVAGKTDVEIGETLSMSVPTVKHYVQQLLLKTGLSNRTQIAVTAVSSGLIDIKVTKL